MDFALSTTWFADRFATGEELVDEALSIGFDGLELGYTLQMGLVPGILSRVKDGAVSVRSVHSYCPAPMGQSGSPELHDLVSRSEQEREHAVQAMLSTLHFAESVGAEAVVVHAGRVASASNIWPWLLNRYNSDAADGWLFRWRHERIRRVRERDIGVFMARLEHSLDDLLPHFERAHIKMALEILPSYDAIPLPDEMDALYKRYSDGGPLSFWYDIGHGQVLENTGYISVNDVVTRFAGRIAGCHIHDVLGPATDHYAPGDGGIDYKSLSQFADPSVIRVFEPSPDVPRENLAKGLAIVRKAWNMDKDQ